MRVELGTAPYPLMPELLSQPIYPTTRPISSYPIPSTRQIRWGCMETVERILLARGWRYEER